MGFIDMRETKNRDEDEEVKESDTEDVESDESETSEDAAADSSEAEQTQDESTSEDTAKESKTEEESDASQESEEDMEKKQTLSELEALRLEKQKILDDIKDARKDRREARENLSAKPLFVDKPKDDELKDLNPDDVAMIEKVVRAKGYVPREELQKMTYEEKKQASIDSWVSLHPEYQHSAEGDANWDALKEVLKQPYFSMPPDPRDVVKLLDIAHRQIKDSIKPLPVRSGAEIKEAQKKIDLSSKGDSNKGSKGSAPAKTAKANDVNRSYLKGFSDEEMDEIFS